MFVMNSFYVALLVDQSCNTIVRELDWLLVNRTLKHSNGKITARNRFNGYDLSRDRCVIAVEK